MSTGQIESGSGAAPPSGSEVCSEEGYEPSSSRPTMHKGGRGCTLMGSGNVMNVSPNSCQLLITYWFSLYLQHAFS